MGAPLLVRGGTSATRGNLAQNMANVGGWTNTLKKYARQNGFIFRFGRVNMFELPPPNMANEDVSSVILLMVQKSGDHHLGCIRNPVDIWINDQSTGAGFLPWIVLCYKAMPAAFFLLRWVIHLGVSSSGDWTLKIDKGPMHPKINWLWHLTIASWIHLYYIL